MPDYRHPRWRTWWDPEERRKKRQQALDTLFDWGTLAGGAYMIAQHYIGLGTFTLALMFYSMMKNRYPLPEASHPLAPEPQPFHCRNPLCLQPRKDHEDQSCCAQCGGFMDGEENEYGHTPACVTVMCRDEEGI